MSAAEHLPSSSGWSFTRLFRAGSRPDQAADTEPVRTISNVRQDQNRDLLGSICEFLIDNDLPIEPRNLTAAYYALSGSHPRLGREVTRRLSGGYRVTQEWLDDIADIPDPKQEQELSRRMMDELDAGLRQFARNTTEARSAANDYSSNLEQHQSAMCQVNEAADVVNRLIMLAKDMADRTRRIEGELQEREQEAKSLRRRLSKVKREAELDHLTGLPNRRAFETRFASELEEARKANETLNIAICDIDHFKTINDTHGHETGDRILQLIAKLLARISNERCHIARHGGEEFVMLFRGFTSDEAIERLNNARLSLAERRLVNRDTGLPIGNVTFSAGIADVMGFADPRQAIRAADEALYRAKEAGRNAICRHEG